jgi:hypothetical protein
MTVPGLDVHSADPPVLSHNFNTTARREIPCKKRKKAMKLSILATLAMLSPALAFVPASTHQTTSALNAQMDRKAFIASAVAGTIVVASPLIANAGTMGQERVSDPTEV